ncbi:MAG: TlpA family protein disulfide reductase, partial [Fimbriimonadaceae bacterium]
DQGRLLRYRMEVRSMMGTKRSETRFSNWRVLTTVPETTFRPRIPSGYTPVSFERDPIPVQIGQKLPQLQLTGPDGKAVGFDRLKGSRGLLLVVVRGACEPSRRMLKALATTLGGLPAKGVNVAYVSFDGKPVAGLPVHTAAAETIEKRLGIPGTPFLMLVRADGVVRWLYFGSNPDNPEEPRATLESLAPLDR